MNSKKILARGYAKFLTFIFYMLCLSFIFVIPHFNSSINVLANKDEDTGVKIGILTTSLDDELYNTYDSIQGNTYHAEKNNGELSFRVEVNAIVNYDINFKIEQKRISTAYFPAFGEYISENGYDSNSDDYFNEYQNKLTEFDSEQERLLAQEGNLFVINSNTYTIASGTKYIDINFSMKSDIEAGNGLRASTISINILTQNVEANYDFKQYRGSVNYNIYDLDGDNELLILNPSDAYENDGFINIPIIRTGDNSKATNNVPSFSYSISNNINIGGDITVTAESRFENWNSNFTFLDNGTTYADKINLKINIINNNEIGFFEQFRLSLSNFENCGEVITTTIIGEKFAPEDTVKIVFAIFDDEYEKLNLEDYTLINILQNNEENSLPINYSSEFNYNFIEASGETEILLGISKGNNVEDEQIQIKYEILESSVPYGEYYTFGENFDSHSLSGEILAMKSNSRISLPITIIDNNELNADIHFKLRFTILNGENVIFERGNSYLGVAITENDYAPNNNHVEFGFFNNSRLTDELFDMLKPYEPEHYDGDADVVISASTYYNDEIKFELTSQDYFGNIPLSIGVKFEDITAKAGTDYTTSNLTAYATTNLQTGEDFSFKIINKSFGGVKRFKISIISESLPLGLTVGERNEIIIDIVGSIPTSFWNMDTKPSGYFVNKGESVMLELTRYDIAERTTKIALTDYYEGSVSVADYFEDTFPLSINWAENETRKVVYIPTINNQVLEEQDIYLKLVLLDNNESALVSVNDLATSCEVTIKNNFVGGTYFLSNDTDRAFMMSDGKVYIENLVIDGITEKSTVYYRLLEDDSVAESERAINGIDFIAGDYSYTFEANQSTKLPIYIPNVLSRNGDLRKLKVEIYKTSKNAVLGSNNFRFTLGESCFLTTQVWLDYTTRIQSENLLQAPHISPYFNNELRQGIVLDNYENAQGGLNTTLDPISGKDLSNIVIDFNESNSISL